MSAPVWLITGTSNGFGLLLALKALAAKHRVIGTVRSKTKSADAVRQITDAGGEVIELDMTDSQADIHAKVAAAEKIYGQVDILVNNAGYSILGAMEQFSEDEVKLQYQTNVYGPLFTTQAVLPGMRARRAGTIVNMSSGAGQDARATRGLYGASKFALEGTSEAIASETAEFGIAVLIVEPGMFRTNFFHAVQTPAAALPAGYQGSVVEKTIGMFAGALGTQKGDPQKLVERVFEVVTGEGLAGSLKGKVMRLPIGMDAIERVEAKSKLVLSEVAEAKKLEEQQSTAFPN